MSISPPSDIVLDVAQAADPTRLQAATAKLAKIAAGAAGDGEGNFAAVLGSAAADSGRAAPASAASRAPYGALTIRAAPTMSPYQKFEAVMLQNFLQNVLPKDEELFGDAASADICRSMLAEQVANQIAKTGKIGIAHLIEHAHGLNPPAASDPRFKAVLDATTPSAAAAAAATGPGAAALASLSTPRLTSK